MCYTKTSRFRARLSAYTRRPIFSERTCPPVPLFLSPSECQLFGLSHQDAVTAKKQYDAIDRALSKSTFLPPDKLCRLYPAVDLSGCFTPLQCQARRDITILTAVTQFCRDGAAYMALADAMRERCPKLREEERDAYIFSQMAEKEGPFQALARLKLSAIADAPHPEADAYHAALQVIGAYLDLSAPAPDDETAQLVKEFFSLPFSYGTAKFRARRLPERVIFRCPNQAFRSSGDGSSAVYAVTVFDRTFGAMYACAPEHGPGAFDLLYIDGESLRTFGMRRFPDAPHEERTARFKRLFVDCALNGRHRLEAFGYKKDGSIGGPVPIVCEVALPERISAHFSPWQTFWMRRGFYRPLLEACKTRDTRQAELRASDVDAEARHEKMRAEVSRLSLDPPQ